MSTALWQSLVPLRVTRILSIALEVGPGSVSVMIDHPDLIDYLPRFLAIAESPVSVSIKIDSGYHRAGLLPTALNKGGCLRGLQSPRDRRIQRSWVSIPTKILAIRKQLLRQQ